MRLMLRLRPALFALFALASACERGPLFTTQSVLGVTASQPTFLLQWDSSELRHPRADTFTFDGQRFVRASGMAMSFVHPSRVVGAVESPSAVIVHQSGTAYFATGPDGYVLAPTFARPSLASLGDSFAALETDPQTGAFTVLSIDDRGRERWRRALPDGTTHCPAGPITTPDRARVALFSATGCVGVSTLYTWDAQGAPATPIEHQALTAPDGLTFSLDATAAVRDDLTVAVATSALSADRKRIGWLNILSPISATPTRLELGSMAVQRLAPIGASRWLIVARVFAYRDLARSNGSTDRIETENTQAMVVTDTGAIDGRVELFRYATASMAVVATPRGTALFVASDGRDNPRLLAWAPDGRRLSDERIDLDRVAAEVEPPIDAGR
jgi:hypothetical protein